jgi:hypothetical protein
MPRAYIVLRRNDLADNFLEVLDLIPNTSQRRFPYETYGQTEYLSHFLIDGVNLPPITTGAGPIYIDGDSYGLSSYCIDRIEYTSAAGRALTGGVGGEAAQVAAAFEALASTGAALTAAALNAAVVGVLGAGNDLTGIAGNSIGTVEEVLRILTGERYKMPDQTMVEDGANAFVNTIGGYFTTGIGRFVPTTTGPGGRKSTDRVIPETPATQVVDPALGVYEDLEHLYFRRIYDTGDLHRSALLGVLAELKDPTFSFLNPDFTYSAVAPLGTALTLDGTNIPASGQAAAVQVYAADGTVI